MQYLAEEDMIKQKEIQGVGHWMQNFLGQTSRMLVVWKSIPNCRC